MPYASHLIDRAKTGGDFQTYSALADALGIDKGTLSNWRRGHGSPIPQERIIELCKLAGIVDTGPWLVAAQADASRSDAVRAALETVLDRLRPALAGVGLGVLGLVGFLQPYQAQATTTSEAEPLDPLCIMRSLARWLRAAWTRAAAWSAHEPTALLA